MTAPRKPRQSGINVFWTLLEALERTTHLEFSAIKERNFEAMEALHEAKRSDFARLVALGARLGLNRENRDFDLRLQALARAEQRNADLAAREASALRVAWEEQGRDAQRLHSLKKAYVSDTLESEFRAEG